MAAKSTKADRCATCKGSTDTPDMVFHWANAMSAKLIAMTCSDECADKFEAARALVDGAV